MKNWKIGTLITAGFAIVIVICAALGIFAYEQVDIIKKRSVDVTEQSLPAVETMGEVKGNQQRTMSLLLQHIVVTDHEEILRIEEKMRTSRQANNELLSKYEK